MIDRRYMRFFIILGVGVFLLPLSPVFGQEDAHAHYYDYQIDEDHRRLLDAAWEYYANDEERRRDVSLRLFQDFIDKYPDSPMVPEVYYRMGTLYSGAANRLFDEKVDFDQMNVYFSEAVETYGPGWAKYKQIAWASIANTPRIDISERIEFYQWMIDSRENIIWSDIHPARQISRYFRGDTALMTVDTRRNFVTGPDGNPGIEDVIIQPAMRVSARNIVRRLGLEELQQIERLFDGYYIAEEARKKIGVIQANITDMIDSPIDAPANEYTAGRLGEDRQYYPDLDSPAAEDQRGTNAHGDGSKNARIETTSRVSMKYILSIIGLCVSICVAVVLFLRIKWRRPIV